MTDRGALAGILHADNLAVEGYCNHDTDDGRGWCEAQADRIGPQLDNAAVMAWAPEEVRQLVSAAYERGQKDATAPDRLLVNFGPDLTPEQVDEARRQIESLAAPLDVSRLADALHAVTCGPFTTIDPQQCIHGRDRDLSVAEAVAAHLAEQEAPQ